MSVYKRIAINTLCLDKSIDIDKLNSSAREPLPFIDVFQCLPEIQQDKIISSASQAKQPLPHLATLYPLTEPTEQLLRLTQAATNVNVKILDDISRKQALEASDIQNLTELAPVYPELVITIIENKSAHIVAIAPPLLTALEALSKNQRKNYLNNPELECIQGLIETPNLPIKAQYKHTLVKIASLQLEKHTTGKKNKQAVKDVIENIKQQLEQETLESETLFYEYIEEGKIQALDHRFDLINALLEIIVIQIKSKIENTEDFRHWNDRLTHYIKHLTTHPHSTAPKNKAIAPLLARLKSPKTPEETELLKIIQTVNFDSQNSLPEIGSSKCAYFEINKDALSDSSNTTEEDELKHLLMDKHPIKRKHFYEKLNQKLNLSEETKLLLLRYETNNPDEDVIPYIELVSLQIATPYSTTASQTNLPMTPEMKINLAAENLIEFETHIIQIFDELEQEATRPLTQTEKTTIIDRYSALIEETHDEETKLQAFLLRDCIQTILGPDPDDKRISFYINKILDPKDNTPPLEKTPYMLICQAIQEVLDLGRLDSIIENKKSERASLASEQTAQHEALTREIEKHSKDIRCINNLIAQHNIQPLTPEEIQALLTTNSEDPNLQHLDQLISDSFKRLLDSQRAYWAIQQTSYKKRMQLNQNASAMATLSETPTQYTVSETLSGVTVSGSDQSHFDGEHLAALRNGVCNWGASHIQDEDIVINLWKSEHSTESDDSSFHRLLGEGPGLELKNLMEKFALGLSIPYKRLMNAIIKMKPTSATYSGASRILKIKDHRDHLAGETEKPGLIQTIIRKIPNISIDDLLFLEPRMDKLTCFEKNQLIRQKENLLKITSEHLDRYNTSLKNIIYFLLDLNWRNRDKPNATEIAQLRSDPEQDPHLFHLIEPEYFARTLIEQSEIEQSQRVTQQSLLTASYAIGRDTHGSTSELEHLSMEPQYAIPPPRSRHPRTQPSTKDDTTSISSLSKSKENSSADDLLVTMDLLEGHPAAYNFRDHCQKQTIISDESATTLRKRLSQRTDTTQKDKEPITLLFKTWETTIEEPFLGSKALPKPKKNKPQYNIDRVIELNKQANKQLFQDLNDANFYITEKEFMELITDYYTERAKKQKSDYIENRKELLNNIVDRLLKRKTDTREGLIAIISLVMNGQLEEDLIITQFSPQTIDSIQHSLEKELPVLGQKEPLIFHSQNKIVAAIQSAHETISTSHNPAGSDKKSKRSANEIKSLLELDQHNPDSISKTSLLKLLQETEQLCFSAAVPDNTKKQYLNHLINATLKLDTTNLVPPIHPTVAQRAGQALSTVARIFRRSTEPSSLALVQRIDRQITNSRNAELIQKWNSIKTILSLRTTKKLHSKYDDLAPLLMNNFPIIDFLTAYEKNDQRLTEGLHTLAQDDQTIILNYYLNQLSDPNNLLALGNTLQKIEELKATAHGIIDRLPPDNSEHENPSIKSIENAIIGHIRAMVTRREGTSNTYDIQQNWEKAEKLARRYAAQISPDLFQFIKDVNKRKRILEKYEDVEHLFVHHPVNAFITAIKEEGSIEENWSQIVHLEAHSPSEPELEVFIKAVVEDEKTEKEHDFNAMILEGPVTVLNAASPINSEPPILRALESILKHMPEATIQNLGLLGTTIQKFPQACKQDTYRIEDLLITLRVNHLSVTVGPYATTSALEKIHEIKPLTLRELSNHGLEAAKCDELEHYYQNEGSGTLDMLTQTRIHTLNDSIIYDNTFIEPLQTLQKINPTLTIAQLKKLGLTPETIKKFPQNHQSDTTKISDLVEQIVIAKGEIQKIIKKIQLGETTLDVQMEKLIEIDPKITGAKLAALDLEIDMGTDPLLQIREQRIITTALDAPDPTTVETDIETAIKIENFESLLERLITQNPNLTWGTFLTEYAIDNEEHKIKLSTILQTNEEQETDHRTPLKSILIQQTAKKLINEAAKAQPNFTPIFTRLVFIADGLKLSQLGLTLEELNPILGKLPANFNTGTTKISNTLLIKLIIRKMNPLFATGTREFNFEEFSIIDPNITVKDLTDLDLEAQIIDTLIPREGVAIALSGNKTISSRLTEQKIAVLLTQAPITFDKLTTTLEEIAIINPHITIEGLNTAGLPKERIQTFLSEEPDKNTPISKLIAQLKHTHYLIQTLVDTLNQTETLHNSDLEALVKLRPNITVDELRDIYKLDAENLRKIRSCSESAPRKIANCFAPEKEAPDITPTHYMQQFFLAYSVPLDLEHSPTSGSLISKYDISIEDLQKNSDRRDTLVQYQSEKTSTPFVTTEKLIKRTIQMAHKQYADIPPHTYNRARIIVDCYYEIFAKLSDSTKTDLANILDNILRLHDVTTNWSSLVQNVRELIFNNDPDTPLLKRFLTLINVQEKEIKLKEIESLLSSIETEGNNLPPGKIQDKIALYFLEYEGINLHRLDLDWSTTADVKEALTNYKAQIEQPFLIDAAQHTLDKLFILNMKQIILNRKKTHPIPLMPTTLLKLYEEYIEKIKSPQIIRALNQAILNIVKGPGAGLLLQILKNEDYDNPQLKEFAEKLFIEEIKGKLAPQKSRHYKVSGTINIRQTQIPFNPFQIKCLYELSKGKNVQQNWYYLDQTLSDNEDWNAFKTAITPPLPSPPLPPLPPQLSTEEILHELNMWRLRLAMTTEDDAYQMGIKQRTQEPTELVDQLNKTKLTPIQHKQLQRLLKKLNMCKKYKPETFQIIETPEIAPSTSSIEALPNSLKKEIRQLRRHPTKLRQTPSNTALARRVAKLYTCYGLNPKYSPGPPTIQVFFTEVGN